MSVTWSECEVAAHEAKLAASKIDPEKRKAAQEHSEAIAEGKLQEYIAGYLRLKGIWFRRNAMHKRHTGTKGEPDFICCANGRFVALECKVGKNDLDPDQEVVRTGMLAAGAHYDVVRSLKQAIDFIKPML